MLFRRKVEEKPELKALPLSQRVKSYSAASGYVYEYIFLGLEGERHVFEVSADRSAKFRVQVELSEAVVRGMSEAMGVAPRWNDLYAIAKLSLFAAFDALPDPAAMRAVVAPGMEDVRGYMHELKMLP
jgi:hypothetical protein